MGSGWDHLFPELAVTREQRRAEAVRHRRELEAPRPCNFCPPLEAGLAMDDPDLWHSALDPIGYEPSRSSGDMNYGDPTLPREACPVCGGSGTIRLV